MPDQPYQPIACADYDIYEIAIMQGCLLMLKWKLDSGEIFEQSVKPVKLEIKNGAEYLIFESQGMQIMKIRLDKILHAEIVKK